jgi:hypothetical protein
MTLSNFDWTDKDSVKWFIMLPTGHEGPYSLKQLVLQKVPLENKIWAVGLEEAVLLRDVLGGTVRASEPDMPPELPPLPIEQDDDLPPIPFLNEDESSTYAPEEISEEVSPKKTFGFPIWGYVSVAVFLVVVFALGSVIKIDEKFDLHRQAKMTLQLHERILKENAFDGWDKKIFFKEYLPDDHSHIWLVTTSYQNCQVEASFNSLKDKLLTAGDEKISFKSEGVLKDHLVEFSSFDFTSGNKIVPGLYEMDVKASHCQWDGFIPKIMNRFSSPDKEYQARTKVVLFSKGAEEFNRVLDKLLKKKVEVARKEENQNEIFWQDLQQKFETLNAITLQIEQHVLDFLDIPPGPPGSFSKNLKTMVDQYTRQFGSFLTSFVVENENYFKNLNSEAKGASKKRNYELMVKLTTKRIGLETMKYIEEFQGIKKAPNKEELEKYSDRVKKVYSSIKNDITLKIKQVSADRSK